MLPTVDGPEHVSLNHGLHFTGGEPFLNFNLLYPQAPGILIELSVEPSAGVFLKQIVKTQGSF